MSYNHLIIERKLRQFLEEDCSYKDVTSQLIPQDAISTANIIAKSEGYVSGLSELRLLYNLLDINLTFYKEDGEFVNKSEKVVKLEGPTRKILFGERIGLNLITHMSAITTSTRMFVTKIKKQNKKVKIACTRKTLPGLRIFEKRAVELGGGDTHRFSLDDMILLKDTHLKFYKGDVKKMLKDTKKFASFSKKVEVEVEKIDDVLIAAQNGADIIMLDNMDPDQVKASIDLLKAHNRREGVLIEISGGITDLNIDNYLQSEPDIISSSQITQFPHDRIDLSLRFE